MIIFDWYKNMRKNSTRLIGLVMHTGSLVMVQLSCRDSHGPLKDYGAPKRKEITVSNFKALKHSIHRFDQELYRSAYLEMKGAAFKS